MINIKEEAMKQLQIFLGMLIILFLFTNCQQQNINVNPSAIKLQTGKQYQITTLLEKQNQPIDSTDIQIDMQCLHGKIENGIYYAPMQASEDTLTFHYLGKKLTQNIQLEIIESKQQPETFIATTETISSSPLIQELPQWEQSTTPLPSPEPSRPAPEPIKPKDPIYTIEAQFTPTQPKVGQSVSYSIQIFKDEVKIPALETDLQLTADKGTFINGKYQSPWTSKTDNIHIKHLPTGTQKTFPINMIAEENIEVFNDLIKVIVPFGWEIHTSSLSISATVSEGEFAGTELNISILGGLDFLEVETISLLLKRNDSKSAQDIEEEIEFGGIEGIFLSLNKFQEENKTKKAWWVLGQKDDLLYIFTLMGPKTVFEKYGKTILNSVQFTQKKWESYDNLNITKSVQLIKSNLFNINLPTTWDYTNIGGTVLFACDSKKYQDQSISLSVIAFPLKNMSDLSLDIILEMFRHCALSDTEIEILKESNITISDYEGRMIDMKNESKSGNKLCLIVLKSSTTAYGIIFSFTEKIEKENPDFIKNTIKSFQLHE